MNCSQKAEARPTLRVLFLLALSLHNKAGAPPSSAIFVRSYVPVERVAGVDRLETGGETREGGSKAEEERERPSEMMRESASVLQPAERALIQQRKSPLQPDENPSVFFLIPPSLCLHYSFHLLHNSLALPDSLLPAPAVALWIIFQPRTGVPILYRPPLISAAMDSQRLSDSAKSCREDGLCLLFCY